MAGILHYNSPYFPEIGSLTKLELVGGQQVSATLPAVSDSHGVGLWKHMATPGFLCTSWDLNSSPYACAATILTY